MARDDQDLPSESSRPEGGHGMHAGTPLGRAMGRYASRDPVPRDPEPRRPWRRAAILIGGGILVLWLLGGL